MNKNTQIRCSYASGFRAPQAFDTDLHLAFANGGVSRIFLDNINHIQASWFSEGYKTGQIALSFGADDFGGTLFDENVMLSAGFYKRTSVDGIKKLINDAGYEAVQRTTEYDLIEVTSKAI